MISEQILSGNGIRVPLIRLEDRYIPVNGAIPFLDQLPLVPILFALMGGLTHESYLPAQALNLLSHVAIAFFTFLLMKQLCGRKSIALLTGMLVSFSYPLLWATNHISTEPLFVAMTAGTMYFFVLSRNAGHGRYSRHILIAAAFAGTSILTRNAGIAVIPVFFWALFVLFIKKRPEAKYPSNILAIALPVITIMTLFLRNYMVSGSLRGFEQVSPERSLPEAFAGIMQMIYDQFHLGGNAIILIKLSALVFIGAIFISADLRKKLSKSMGEGLDLIIVFMISYTALICLTMATQQWRFEVRYMYPLVPFLFVVCNLMIVFLWDSIGLTKLKKISLAGMVLSLSIVTLGSCYKTYVNFHEFSYKQEKAYALLSSCAFDWIKANIAEDTVIVTNRPFHLGFFGGYPTVALPHKRFNPTIIVPEDMERVLPQQMLKFGASAVALFVEAEEQYEGKYIATLFNKRGSDDNFSMAYECSDGVVYTLVK